MRTRTLSAVVIGLFAIIALIGSGCGSDEVSEGGADGSETVDADVSGDTDPSPEDTSDDGADAAPDDTGSTGDDTEEGDTAGDTGGDADAGPTVCRSDEDCPDDEVCRVDRSGDAVELTCQPPPGDGGSVGDSCQDDSDCRSNLCLDGTCTKPCERPVQCEQDGWTCDSADVETDGGSTESVNVCQKNPARSCQSDGDCADPKKCIADRGTDSIEFICDSPNSNGDGLGESCQSDADCERNLCTDGVCTGACSTNDDCSEASGYTCDMTSVDLGNGNTDSAAICVPPRPCDHAGECKVDEVCYFERDRTDAAGICRDHNPGGNDPGEVCDQDGHCKANLCYESRFRDICSIPCKSVNDCQQGFRCEETDIADGQGGTISENICVPAPPSSCDKQSDCGAGESCAIVTTTDGNDLESVCIPDPGGLATGNACQQDDDCKSQVCLDGHCASPCTSRDQCANDQVCRQNSVSKQGASGDFVVCETLPEEDCTSTGSCSDGTRVCSDLQNASGDIKAYCQFPNSGASGSLGDSCSQNVDCKSDLCASEIGAPLRDACTVACRSDSQCPAGQICTTLPFSNTDVAACAKPCSQNGDCSGNNVCMINENQLGNSSSIDTVCRKRFSGATFTESCGGTTRCESGLCLLTYTFDQTALNNSCNSDADCSSGRGCHTNDDDGNDYCAQEERRCTRVCTSDSHCSKSCNTDTDCPGTDNTCQSGSCSYLTTCSSSVTMTLSDGSTTNINACAQQ